MLYIISLSYPLHSEVDPLVRYSVESDFIPKYQALNKTLDSLLSIVIPGIYFTYCLNEPMALPVWKGYNEVNLSLTRWSLEDWWSISGLLYVQRPD